MSKVKRLPILPTLFKTKDGIYCLFHLLMMADGFWVSNYRFILGRERIGTFCSVKSSVSVPSAQLL